MKKIATFLAWLALASNVAAQTLPGQVPAWGVVGNPSSSVAPVARGATITQMFDGAYCSTIGFAIVRFTGAWTCAKWISANPVWWGADPTGAADSAAAFNSALAASTVVQFPAGKFKFLSQVSYSVTGTPGSVTITGVGADNTILFWPSGNGLVLSLTNAKQSFHIRDLTFSSGAAPGGTGLSVSSTTNGVLTQNDIINTTFRGDDFGASNYWTSGVNVSIVNDINFINDQFLGLNSGGAPIAGSGNGVVIAGSVSFLAFNFYFTNCNFNQLNNGINVGSYVQGIQIVGSAFGGQVGINVGAGLLGTLAVLSVVGSQFANDIGIVMATNFFNYMFSQNTFFIPTGLFGINITANGGGTIVGNTFQPTGSSNVGTGAVISATAAGLPTAVTGNTFWNLATGLALLAASANVNVQGNAFNANTTHISNLSTSLNNAIANNLGFNPVGYTAGTSTGTSAAVIGAGPSPETHYITQSANFNAVVAKCTALACGTSTNICTVPSATVPCVIQLGPNENYKVTWATTQPTYTKDVH